MQRSICNNGRGIIMLPNCWKRHPLTTCFISLILIFGIIKCLNRSTVNNLNVFSRIYKLFIFRLTAKLILLRAMKTSLILLLMLLRQHIITEVNQYRIQVHYTVLTSWLTDILAFPCQVDFCVWNYLCGYTNLLFAILRGYYDDSIQYWWNR